MWCGKPIRSTAAAAAATITGAAGKQGLLIAVVQQRGDGQGAQNLPQYPPPADRFERAMAGVKRSCGAA
ncbi:hypothetical protein [Streptomyces sp. NBC_00847]|uniref:hypothetical protein n=1 Tax=unclassified Streptomyces TaxID=2593676 RepID=UPI00225DEFFA|nr:hypothetical protein [Streptomyces sp. NBC_00847]MCX4885309.1 hypothetical protein [Streptomyces sp. NBC_00847]